MSPSHARDGTPVRRWAWISGVLAAVAAACLVMAVHTAGPGEPRDAVAEAPSESSTPSADPDPVASPVGLRIPSIDVAAKVTQLGLTKDQTVEVPSNPADTGWYRLGPPPGQVGAAVILGHVDSMQGPAVFYRLRHLKPGDRVLVDAADGSTSTFRVVRLATYPNEKFPARKVYVAEGHRRVLNLVTCGGEYDPATGYQANVVVYTRLVHTA